MGLFFSYFSAFLQASLYQLHLWVVKQPVVGLKEIENKFNELLLRTKLRNFFFSEIKSNVYINKVPKGGTAL